MHSRGTSDSHQKPHAICTSRFEIISPLDLSFFFWTAFLHLIFLKGHCPVNQRILLFLSTKETPSASMTCTAAFPCHHRLKRKACYSLFTEFPSLCVCIIAFRCAQSSSPGLFMCHMLMLQSSSERKPNAIWCNYYGVCFDCKIRHYICFI